ncbi:MAG: GAF domain-containing protein [Gammaproteobacteria bacterium]|nr:GAF domain-containing protein [Gammaproteobacteria bacterium]
MTNPQDVRRSFLRGPLPEELQGAVARLKALTAPQSMRASRWFWLVAWLTSSGVTLGGLALYYAWDAGASVGIIAAVSMVLSLLVLSALLVKRLRARVLGAEFQVRKWIVCMLDGDLDARVTPVGQGGEVLLLQDINVLGDMISRMCKNVDQQTRIQVEQLAQKTRSLEILYDAAAGVNVLHDVNDLLTRFLHTLCDMVQARAGVVRLMTEDGQMRLIATVGCDESVLARTVSIEQCLSGARAADELLIQTDVQQCEPGLQISPDGGCAALVTIPIRYSERTLGVYHLVLESAALIEREDISHLFSSIGRHLGIAIEKARLERHARRLSIMEERTLLANELHDSLAQTLASLRFQVTLVEETVAQSKDRTGIRQIRTIKDGLDQANSQLRELLAHFRTRMDERGLIPAIESVVERFRKETGIAAFFQNEIVESNLPPSLEVQVLHIVQESLTNVRKHSDAQNVRVLLRTDDNRDYHVLVEDDGQGIEEKVVSDPPGEHIGLSIMRERAARLGGTLSIESEAGEGTRVELQFSVPPQRHNHERDDITQPKAGMHE